MALYGAESGAFSELKVSNIPPESGESFAGSIAYCRQTSEYAFPLSESFILSPIFDRTGGSHLICQQPPLFVEVFQPPFGSGNVPIDFEGPIGLDGLGQPRYQLGLIKRGQNNFTAVGHGWQFNPGISADFRVSLAAGSACRSGHYNCTCRENLVTLPFAVGAVQCLIQAVDSVDLIDVTPAGFTGPSINFSFDSVALIGRPVAFFTILRVNNWPDLVVQPFGTPGEIIFQGALG